MAQFLDIRIAQHGTNNYYPVRIPNPTRIQYLQQCYEEKVQRDLRAVIRIDSAGAPNATLTINIRRRALTVFHIAILCHLQITCFYRAV